MSETSSVAVLQRPAHQEFLSSDELLQQLIDRPWLRSAALSCVLPAVRINGHWQYRRSDLDLWLATQPEGPNA